MNSLEKMAPSLYHPKEVVIVPSPLHRKLNWSDGLRFLLAEIPKQHYATGCGWFWLNLAWLESKGEHSKKLWKNLRLAKENRKVCVRKQSSMAECLSSKETGMNKGHQLLCARTAGRRSEGILESLRLLLPWQAWSSGRLEWFQRRP